MSRVLGIDPATKCGWALLDNGARVASGTWDCSIKPNESKGMRFVRFERQLLEVLEGGVDLVMYEDVKYLRGIAASQVYGGIIGVMKLVLEKKRIEYAGIGVSEVKKLATGKGNADKKAMIAAAKVRWGLPGDPTEDEADALWIALAGSERLVA